MSKMDESDVIKELSSSKKFFDTYNQCSDKIKDLFIKLAVESSVFSDNYNGYAKEMKETSYRLARPYIKGRKIQNYCMFTLVIPDKIRVDIRTDRTPISSEILHLRNSGNCFSGGFEWHQFYINDEGQLPEAIRLIEYCYKI